MCIPDGFRYISMKTENIFAASFAADTITSKWGPDGFVSHRHREERQRNCARKMKIRGFVNAVSDFATHADPIRKTRNYNENLFLRTAEGNPMIDKAYKMVLAAA